MSQPIGFRLAERPSDRRTQVESWMNIYTCKAGSKSPRVLTAAQL